MLSLYQGKCWFIVDWTTGNLFQWNLNQRQQFMCRKSTWNFVCKRVAILSGFSMLRVPLAWGPIFQLHQIYTHAHSQKYSLTYSNTLVIQSLLLYIILVRKTFQVLILLNINDIVKTTSRNWPHFLCVLTICSSMEIVIKHAENINLYHHVSLNKLFHVYNKHPYS